MTYKAVSVEGSKVKVGCVEEVNALSSPHPARIHIEESRLYIWKDQGNQILHHHVETKMC